MIGTQFKAAHESLEVVFDIMRRSYLDQIIASEFDDTPLREECYRSIKILDSMAQVFRTIVATGELAAADIEHMAQVKSGVLKEFH